MKRVDVLFVFMAFALAVIAKPRQAFSITAPREISGTEVLTKTQVIARIADSGKGTVIVFLSARCPCSASHEKRLAELYSRFAPQGFRFIGIHSNSDESPEMTRLHFSESHLPFPVIQDEGSRVADHLSAFKTPHVFVVGLQGQVLFQGGVDDSHIAESAKKHYLEEALGAITVGREPSQKEVRSLGCVIKRP